MGAIRSGIPKQETEFLKKIMHLNTFIEGGTYYGDTSLYASNLFKKVFTVENSHIIFEKAFARLQNISNIKVFEGDTRNHLKKLSASNSKILYWLDSHWSGGDTYGEGDECPLMEELKTIFKSKNESAILIDDARLFISPPPIPHDVKDWPSIKEITDIVPKDYDVMVYEDVIYIVPLKYKEAFWKFVQLEKTNKDRKSFKNSFLLRKYRKVVHYIEGILTSK